MAAKFLEEKLWKIMECSNIIRVAQTLFHGGSKSKIFVSDIRISEVDACAYCVIACDYPFKHLQKFMNLITFSITSS